MIRNIFLYLIIIGFCSLDLSANVQSTDLKKIIPNFEQTDMYKLREKYEEVWKGVPNNKRKGWKQFKRWEYFWTQRLFPNGDYRSAIDIYSNVFNKYQFEKNEKLQSNSWRLIGPINPPVKYNATDNIGIGRVNIVRFHPTNPDIIWIGAATGGVWVTKDAGKTWTTFPFTQFLSLGVSDIAISPTDPNIVYVATGDADGSLGTGGNFYSIGVIKTTDGGNTWKVTNLANQLADNNVISRLKVHAKDPNIVLAATNGGILKTIDGGNTWEQKITSNFRDMEVKPDDNNYVYAATSSRYANSNSIFISKDFGDNWEQSINIAGAGRIQLAVSPKAPENIYVLSSATYHDGFHSFIVSSDAGKTYGVMSDSTSGNPLSWAGGNLSENRRGQSSYDLCIAVAPYSKDAVIIGGIENHSSSDMGANWSRTSNLRGLPLSEIHVDMHDLEYHPITEELYCCNDGGIYVSKDEGNTWINLSNGISITQFYRIAQSQTNPEFIIAGAQDNGTSLYINGEWNQLYGGDGMDCAIDARTDNTIWFSIYNGTVLKSKTAGKNYELVCYPKLTDGVDGAWITPFVLDNTDPDVAYIGFANIWKTLNGGSSWQKMTDFGKYSDLFNGIKISDVDRNYVYAWKRNSLYLSKNAGSSWELLPTLESNQITSVSVHPTDPNKFWYTVSGFNAQRKVFYFNGNEFINLTGNLPNVPVNFSVSQKNTNNRIYIGTDIGVFYTDNESNQWTNMNDNLPNLIINDMQIFYGSEVPKLTVGTYGRGIWTTDLNLCNNESIAISPDTNISKCPHEEVTLTANGDYDNYLWSNGETTKSIKVKNEGMYSVSSNKNGCTSRSKAIKVTNLYSPSINISIRNNISPCIGDTLTLVASNGFVTYNWSTGETTRDIQVTKSGTYKVIGQRANQPCESHSQDLELVFMPKPESVDFEVQGRNLVAQDMAKYQWYKNGEIIFGANEKVYVIPETDVEEALYKVFGSNENGCGEFSAEKSAKFTNVIETFTNVYSIYPNPSKGIFNFELFCESGDKVEYSISDASGKIVLEFNQTINSNTFNKNINLSSYPDGAYLMKVTLNGKQKILKLIKK